MAVVRLFGALSVAMAVVMGIAVVGGCTTQRRAADDAKADSLRAGVVTADGVKAELVRGELSGTIDEYLRAVQAPDAPAEAWIQLGNGYAQMGRWAEAIPVWEEALRRGPEAAVAAKVRADIETARKKIAELRARAS